MLCLMQPVEGLSEVQLQQGCAVNADRSCVHLYQEFWDPVVQDLAGCSSEIAVAARQALYMIVVMPVHE